MARNKPVLQRSLQDTAAASFGPVPYEGPEAAQLWMQFLNLYGKLQREVDVHIGQVLATLNSRPQVAANTVIVFTSDHGEYGGSHGLRGKGAGAYEEAIRVPLLVKDNRGVLTQAPEVTRSQLTSSVDIAPLLLTIATGSNDWRGEARYDHIAARADLAAILADPNAPGPPVRAARHRRDRHRVRGRVLRRRRAAARRRAAHAGGEVRDLLELAAGRDRTAGGGDERELYDYATDSGRLELHNGAGESKLEDGLHATLAQAFQQELRAPLPGRLNAAHARGFADYFGVAKNASNNAAAARERRAERYFEGLEEQGGVSPGESRVKQLRSASRARRR